VIDGLKKAFLKPINCVFIFRTVKNPDLCIGGILIRIPPSPSVLERAKTSWATELKKI